MMRYGEKVLLVLFIMIMFSEPSTPTGETIRIVLGTIFALLFIHVPFPYNRQKETP